MCKLLSFLFLPNSCYLTSALFPPPLSLTHTHSLSDTHLPPFLKKKEKRKERKQIMLPHLYVHRDQTLMLYLSHISISGIRKTYFQTITGWLFHFFPDTFGWKSSTLTKVWQSCLLNDAWRTVCYLGNLPSSNFSQGRQMMLAAIFTQQDQKHVQHSQVFSFNHNVSVCWDQIISFCLKSQSQELLALHTFGTEPNEELLALPLGLFCGWQVDFYRTNN